MSAFCGDVVTERSVSDEGQTSGCQCADLIRTQ